MVPNSAGFAGKYGDGLITVGGEATETYKGIFDSFNAGAQEAGKDPSRMPRMIELAVDYTVDEEKAIECRKAFWAGTFVPALFTERIYTPETSEQNGKVVGADTIREAVCISSDPEEHVKLAQKYIDLGFDHIFFHAAGPDQRAFIEVYRRLRPRCFAATKAAGTGKIQIGGLRTTT